MGPIGTIAWLIALSALFSYINHRWLGLPTTIGLMLMGLAASLGLIATGHAVPEVSLWAHTLLDGIDFNTVVMKGMLGVLLFAGALHVNLGDLAQQKFVIGLLATCGVIASTLLVGGLTWLISGALGLEIRPIDCLLFGALISPTDPIAVIGLLKRLGVPKSLATQITGESLFNDGIGVVVFLGLLHIAAPVTGTDPHADGGVSFSILTKLFLQEAVGGAIFGLVCGLTAYYMLRSINNYQVEILISLALVFGGYTLANHLHLSGPIAMVIAGLLIGNHGRALAMSEQTREHLDTFWELVDEVLNAILFLLIGLEVIVLRLSTPFLIAGLIITPAVLLSRFLAVGGTVSALRAFSGIKFLQSLVIGPHTVKVMTWAGLRGGISIALALSIPRQPDSSARELILTVTYIVVVFSIAVQGLTMPPVLRRLGLTNKSIQPLAKH